MKAVRSIQTSTGVLVTLLVLSCVTESCRRGKNNAPQKGDKVNSESTTSSVDSPDEDIAASEKAQEQLESTLTGLGFTKDISNRIKVIIDDADGDLSGTTSERLITLLKRLLVDYEDITEGLSPSESDDLMAGLVASMSLVAAEKNEATDASILISTFAKLVVAVVERAEAQEPQRDKLIRAIGRIVELGTEEVMKDDTPRVDVIFFLSEMMAEALRGMIDSETISVDVRNGVLRKFGSALVEVATDAEYATVWEGMFSYLSTECESSDVIVAVLTNVYWGMHQGVHFSRGTTEQDRLSRTIAVEALMNAHIDALKASALLSAEHETMIRTGVADFSEEVGLINLAPKVCENLEVAYRGLPVVNSTKGNWIALAEAASADTAHLYRYQYLPSGSSGRITFESKGLLPGVEYEIRAYLDWDATHSFTVVARQSFTLTSSATCEFVDVAVTDVTLNLGQPVSFSFSGVTSDSSNWAAVARSDQKNDEYLKFAYLTAAASGTGTVATTGLAEGTYELRLFERWNSTFEYFVYKRVTFTIAAEGCPYNYLSIPANATLGTSAFCVMKYEAKNVGSIATPEASGLPWTGVGRGASSTASGSAWKACKDLGSNFDLISNAQWQAVGRSIEETSANWSNGTTAGQNFLNYGHSDASAGRLAASIDSDPCYGTGQTDCANNTHPDWAQKRTHTLSTGDVIWDMAGNVMEWVKDSNSQTWGTTTYVNQMSSPDYDLSKWGASISYVAKSSAPRGGFGYGIVGENGGGVLRGGFYSEEFSAGIYATDLSYPITQANVTIGFRCVYQP